MRITLADVTSLPTTLDADVAGSLMGESAWSLLNKERLGRAPVPALPSFDRRRRWSTVAVLKYLGIDVAEALAQREPPRDGAPGPGGSTHTAPTSAGQGERGDCGAG